MQGSLRCQSGTVATITDAVTVGTGTSAKNFTFHNALLRKGRNVLGQGGGGVRPFRAVAVELRRCLVYTAADPDATPAVEETCSDDANFRPQVKQTASSGSWSFPGSARRVLLGQHRGTGYNRAK